MQKTLENISSVTLFFLIALGGLHMSSAFLLAEKVENSTILLLFHILDLPFLMVALLYGSARLSLALEDIAEAGKTTLVLSLAVSSLVLIAAFYFNFVFPDVQLS